MLMSPDRSEIRATSIDSKATEKTEALKEFLKKFSRKSWNNNI